MMEACLKKRERIATINQLVGRIYMSIKEDSLKDMWIAKSSCLHKDVARRSFIVLFYHCYCYRPTE